MNTQFKKGVVELCVLSIIDKEDKYGYQIVKDLDQYIDINTNTIYPILRRLTKDGYLWTYEKVSEAGQERKYYTMSQTGRLYYQDILSEWQKFLVSVDKILQGREVYE